MTNLLPTYWSSLHWHWSHSHSHSLSKSGQIHKTESQSLTKKVRKLRPIFNNFANMTRSADYVRPVSTF